jgi:hypothetical protein
MKRPDFSELEPYIAAWDLPSVEERIVKRTSSTLEELRVFHDAMLPRLREIIEFLNRFPPDRIPAEHQALRNAALAVLHADRPVNKWNAVFLKHARDPRLFRMKRSFYDSPDTFDLGPNRRPRGP